MPAARLPVCWRRAKQEPPMSMNALVLLALLATQTPEEAAAPPTPAELAAKAWSDNLALQLRTSSSARERALSARMSVDDPKQAGKVLREAAQAASTDPLVQFLWSSMGPGEWSGCDAASPCPEQSLAWAHIEPDNGLAWLPPFEALYKAGDEKSIDEAIAQMARANRYDDHLVETWLALRKAISARPMSTEVATQMLHGESRVAGDPRDEVIGIMSMAYAAAVPMQLGSISRACRRELHPDSAPERFENCARIGRNVMNSDSSVLMKTIASGWLRVSGMQNDADRETRRVFDWRRQASVDAMNRPHVAEGYFDDLASTGSESRAQELLLTRAGIPLDPPEDWKGRER
jgi:hypothetical protein